MKIKGYKLFPDFWCVDDYVKDQLYRISGDGDPERKDVSRVKSWDKQATVPASHPVSKNLGVHEVRRKKIGMKRPNEICRKNHSFIFQTWRNNDKQTIKEILVII